MYTEYEMNLVAKVLMDPKVDAPDLMEWLSKRGNVYPGWWQDYSESLVRAQLIRLYKTIAYEQIASEITQKFEEDSSNFNFPKCTEQEADKVLREFCDYICKLV